MNPRIAIAWALAAALLPAAAGCHGDLATLQDWMTGSFTSAAQHAADPENYRDIRLHMVPIWKDRGDGPWLYVEQAMAEAPERPYRQRVYRLQEQAGGTLESVVYELPGDPLRFAGAWAEPARLAAVGPAELDLREGCSIRLRRAGPHSFTGSTQGQGCTSTLRGAAYATSEVVIEPQRMTSWDRGFNTAGEQVWGATEGGYEFIKE